MASLQPVSGVLFDTRLDQYVTRQISAVGFDSIISWEWVLVEIGDTPSETEERNITVVEVAEQLTVDYLSEEKLFPLQGISYLDAEGQQVDIGAWDLLPDPSNSPDIIAMREDTKSHCEWSLEVTVTGEVIPPADPDALPGAPPPPPEIVSVSETYTLIVQANYDVSQQILLRELALRS
tara:strand:- start:829 stop:1365 length:537 start_codon:yes stop_codon:yes gene_type:complete